MNSLVLKELKNILSEEDIKQYNELLKVKSDLMSIIGVKNLVEYIKKIIDETEGISFRSQVARDYIDLNNPIFKLQKDNFEMDKSKSEDNEYLDYITNEITNFINENVISKVSSFLSDNIENNPELKEAFENLSKEVRNITFINTYSIRISVTDNIIYLKYMI